MRKMETNDWLVLNTIIYNIYTTEQLEEMRGRLLEQLALLLDFDSADFYLASREEGRLLSDPVTYHCDEDLSEQYEAIDYSRGIVASGKMLVYRESDLMSEEARVQTDYYRKVYQPNRWHYALQLVLARHGRFLGVITLYRTIGKEDFCYDDIFLLDLLKDHLAYRLEQETKAQEPGMDKVTVTEAVERYHLTGREHTILRALMSGEDNAQICEELVIAPNTLKKHILNIYRKLGVKNRVQLFKLVKEFE